MQWSEEEYAEKLRIGGGKERMASLLTDEFVRRQRPAGRRRGPEGAAGRLAPAQDRDLQGDGARRAPARRAPASPGSSTRRCRPAGRWPSPRRRPRSRCARCSSTWSGADAAAHFEVFAGDVVPAKKPDPAIYLLALERMGVARRRRDRGRGLAQRPARRRRRGPALRGDGQRLHRRRGHERGAARRHAAWATRASPRACSPTAARARPGDQVTLADLEACLREPLPHKEAV